MVSLIRFDTWWVRVLRPLALAALLAATGAAQAAETGDPVIDEAQRLLVRITSGKETLSDAKLNEAMTILFARPAFDGIREEGWRYMLFTLIKTRQLVQQYATRYANAKQRSGLAQAAQSMARMEGLLVGLYGPKFSLEEHLQRYPQGRDAFTQNLPTPQEAPTGKFFDRFDQDLRALRAELKALGLSEY